MSINETIAAYVENVEIARSAKKTADAMKKLILEHAKTADNFTTDEYTVVIKTTESFRLDSAALYADFPDIKETYGKITVSKSIDAVKTALATTKSA